MGKEKYIYGVWVHYGYNWKRFGLGFSIDRYAFSLNLGPFWFGVEWA